MNSLLLDLSSVAPAQFLYTSSLWLGTAFDWVDRCQYLIKFTLLARVAPTILVEILHFLGAFQLTSCYVALSSTFNRSFRSVPDTASYMLNLGGRVELKLGPLSPNPFTLRLLLQSWLTLLRVWLVLFFWLATATGQNTTKTPAHTTPCKHTSHLLER